MRFLFVIIQNMFNFHFSKNEKEESALDANESQGKTPELTGERAMSDAGVIAGDLGAKIIEEKLSKESASAKIEPIKVPYNSALKEAQIKHDESLKAFKSAESSNKKYVEPNDSIAQTSTVKEQIATDVNGIGHSGVTTTHTGSHKPHVVTMLSAIEAKAGEKEKQKWLKKLKKEEQELKQQEKSTDPNSPEALLDKQMQSELSAMQNLERSKAPVKTHRPLSIRTFKSDLQGLMQEEKLSLTKIVAIESDRRKYSAEAKKIKKDKQYSFFALAILSFAFLVTASLLAYAWLLQRQSSSAPSAIDSLATQQESLVNPLIFIEDKIRIDISDKPRIYVLRVLQAARDSKKINATLGNVIEFELVKKYQNSFYKISSKELLSILNPNANELFKESLRSNYMLGVHIDNKGRQPFVIFDINSYQFVFAEMLKWEKSMEYDAGIFLSPNYKTAYASSFENQEVFKDATLKNYSVRVLYDKDGKVKLLYGFLGQDTLIITSSPKTFLEIAARVAVEKGQ